VLDIKYLSWFIYFATVSHWSFSPLLISSLNRNPPFCYLSSCCLLEDEPDLACSTRKPLDLLVTTSMWLGLRWRIWNPFIMVGVQNLYLHFFACLMLFVIPPISVSVFSILVYIRTEVCYLSYFLSCFHFSALFVIILFDLCISCLGWTGFVCKKS
jgi:hypothetical protein